MPNALWSRVPGALVERSLEFKGATFVRGGYGDFDFIFE
jgi:hypothetical protein